MKGTGRWSIFVAAVASVAVATTDCRFAYSEVRPGSPLRMES